MNPFLHIQMQINPTRQKFWRVLRLLGIIFSAWSIVIGVHRLFFGYSGIVTPQNVTAIQIVRNSQTIASLRTITKGVNVVPGVPMSLADALEQTSRSITVWFADSGSVTMILDLEMKEQEALALEAFGANISREKNLTIISSIPGIQTVEKKFFNGIFKFEFFI